PFSGAISVCRNRRWPIDHMQRSPRQATWRSNMQKIVPCLWFDTQAEEAANFYVSQIKNSKMGEISYYDEDRHMPPGTPLTVMFQLHGQDFMALNGGPHFQFNHAISF